MQKEFFQMDGGNIKVFTGPKGGKFIIRSNKKVYLDRKSYNDNVIFNKGKKK